MQNDPHCEGKSLKGGDSGTNVVVKSTKCHGQGKHCHHIASKWCSEYLKMWILLLAVMAKSEENENLFSNNYLNTT